MPSPAAVRRLIVATPPRTLSPRRPPSSCPLAGRRRPIVLAVVGLVALAVALVAGVAVGTVADRARSTRWRSSSTGCSGSTSRRPGPATEETIVWDLRLPRVLDGDGRRAGLAVAGATFQGLLRNPLADPYVLGTASGAALGAAIAVLIPVRIELLAFGLLHVLAFVGALLVGHRRLPAVADRPAARR